MAEALLRAAAPGLEVVSAGTGALQGHPADPTAIALMAEQGVDITPHRARQLTAQIGAGADLILALDRGHQHWVNQHFPHLRGRVQLLLAYREDQDVPDPYRQPRAAFENSLRCIQRGVQDWGERLQALSS